MAREPFEHVGSGERVLISAREYNAFIDFVALPAKSGGRTPAGRSRGPAEILVLNASGADREIGEVLVLGGPLVPPRDSLEDFLSPVAVSGHTPTSNPMEPIAILLEAIKFQGIGRAAVAGCVPAIVDVANVDHRYVTVEDGQYNLKSAASGEMVVVGGFQGVGLQWSYVLLDHASSPGPQICKAKLKAPLDGSQSNIECDHVHDLATGQLRFDSDTDSLTAKNRFCKSASEGSDVIVAFDADPSNPEWVIVVAIESRYAVDVIVDVRLGENAVEVMRRTITGFSISALEDAEWVPAIDVESC